MQMSKIILKFNIIYHKIFLKEVEMQRFILLITFLIALPVLTVKADDALARQYFLENNYPKAYDEYKKTTTESLESFVALQAIADYQLLLINDLHNLEELCDNMSDPSPLLYFLVNSNYFRTHTSLDIEEEIEFLEDNLENPKLHPQLISAIQELLSKTYLTINDFDKAQSIKKDLGTIDNWALAGPFENVSSSGFDKQHGPLSNPNNDAVFTRKSGIKTQWFNYHEESPGSWINLANSFSISEALVFAQSYVYSDKEQEVVLGLGVSGSVKIWVNDQLLFKEKKEVNNGIDSYVFTAKLNKGYNRVLIQIGTGENPLSNFLLRFLDKDLKPLPKLISSAQQQNYTKSTNYKSTIIPNFAVEYYDKSIKGTDSEPVLFYMLAGYLNLNNQTLELRKRVETLLKKFPDNFNLLFWDVQNTSMIPDLESSYLVKSEYLKNDKFKNAFSALSRLDDILKKEDWDRAIEILDSLSNEGAADYLLYSLRTSVLAKNKEYSKSVDLIMALHNTYPIDLKLTGTMQVILSYDKQQQDAAYQVFEDYLDDYYNQDFAYSLALHYWRTDRRDEAEELFEKIIKYGENSNIINLKIASFYYQQALYDTALEYYYKLYEKIPYVSVVSSQMAECYREKEEKDSAIKYYKISLDLFPGNFDDRTSLRKLKEEKDIFEKFEEPNTDNIIDNAKGEAEYPDENAIILLMESQQVLYKSGANETVTYFIAKPLTLTGVDMFKENSFGYGTDIIKAEVIKKDGSRVQADKSNGMVVFTKLEPGDVIYYKTKSSSYSSGSLSGYFESSSFFNTYLPLEQAKFSILVEDGIDITYKSTQCNIQPEIKKTNDMTMYSWSAKGLPQIEQETLMPPISDVCAMVHVSTIKDWDFISKWYFDVSNPKTEPSYDVQIKAKELFDGKEQISDMEKVKVIYKYIAQEIRYSSVPFRQSGLVPQNPTKTIDAKIGDCKDVSVLFTSLCKAVGLDAGIVLVSNRENGKNNLALPSIGFEHAIGKVTIDGKVHYVELTTDLLPFGAFYGSSKKAFGLEISKKEKKTLFQIDPDTRPENSINRYTKASIADNNLIIKVNSTKIGGPAATTRSYYRDETADNQRKSMARSISEDYSSTELIDVQFDDNLKDLSDSVTYSYSYKVKKPFTEIKNMKIMRFPWADIMMAGDLTSETERKYPLALWLYMNQDKEYNKVEFEIPKGMKVSEVPESITLKSDFADYSVTYKLEGNKLIGERTVVYKNDFIPADKYQDFKKFYDSMVENDNKQIALEKSK